MFNLLENQEELMKRTPRVSEEDSSSLHGEQSDSKATAGHGPRHRLSIYSYSILILIFILIATAVAGYYLRDSAFAATYINKYLDNQLESGLVGHWTFDGQDMNWASTTAEVTDKSGNHKNGNLVISDLTSVTPGKLGQAMNFGGYVDVNFPDLSAPCTMSSWVKLSTRTSFVSPIIASNTHLNSAFEAEQWNSDSVGITVDAIANYVFSPNYIVPLNTWTHLLTVVTATSDATLYVNGSFAGSIAGATGLSCFQGILGESLNNEGLSGSLDDVRIYNRALSQKEITRLYKLGEGTKINTTPTDKYTNGLVGYWTFDAGDMNGTSAYDRSSNHATATLYGGVTTAIGRLGQGIGFDGTSDYVDVSLFPTLTDYTYSIWIKADTYTNGLASDGNGTYFVDRQVVSNALASLKAIGGNYAHQFRSDTAANLDAILGGTIKIGSWQHVVWGKNGTEFFIYVDGVKTSTTAVIAVTPANPRIGVHQSVTAGFFDGIFDDFRIYNRALMQDEIIGLYNLGTPANINVTPTGSVTSGLVGYWTFDGNNMSGTSAYDISPTRATGTLTNGADPTMGKLGQGVEFDGVDDEITTPTNYGNAATIKTLTLSTWFKTTSPSGHKMIGLESAQTGTGATEYDRMLWMGTDGKIRFGVFTTTVKEVASLNTLTDGRWHHAVGVSTGDSGEIKLYIDGVLQQTTSLGGSVYTSYTSSYWRIGGYRTINWTNGSDGYFNGTLDDVRIYNRVLTADEVQLLYNAGR